jgi:hypothetical protein
MTTPREQARVRRASGFNSLEGNSDGLHWSVKLPAGVDRASSLCTEVYATPMYLPNINTFAPSIVRLRERAYS